jgi:hypothetical protein
MRGEAKHDLPAAAANKESQAGGLYVRGVRKYDAARMREILDRFDSERSKALRSIEEIMQEIIVEAYEEAEVAANFPPDAVLTSSERSSVAERQPLVEADVAGMRTDALAARLRTVLAGGAKVDQYCYWQAARKRQQAIKERMAQSQQGSGAEASTAPLDLLVGQLEEQLLGEERGRCVGHIEERREAAIEVQRICYTGRHGAGTLAGAHAAQTELPAVRRAREAVASS